MGQLVVVIKRYLVQRQPDHVFAFKFNFITRYISKFLHDMIKPQALSHIFNVLFLIRIINVLSLQNIKPQSYGNNFGRARFLSFSAASFFSGASSTFVLSVKPDVCLASKDNPRYLEYELEMKYGEGSGEVGLNTIITFSLAF